MKTSCIHCYVVTTRKLSLGQGNAFTSIYHAVDVGRGSLYDVTSCLADWSHVPSGVPMSLVPCSFGGSLSLVPCSLQGGGGLSRGISLTEPPPPQTGPPWTEPPRMVKSRQEASYWNASLFYF